LTFSESYKRNVLLIDADLRRPALHRVFGTDNASGLTDGLTASAESKLPVRQVSDRLALLQAGQPNADPMAGLTSERMRQVISEARESFDWVIIDSPPVALLPDANLLGAMVDGAVIVVKAATTPCDLVQRAVDAIGRHRILGVVLNRAETTAHGYGYSYYDSYYGARSEALPGS
jgi:capsular exopolysaccharide synthesis family protein